MRRLRAGRPLQGAETDMDIQHYHRDHAAILGQIEALRALSRDGIAGNGAAIGQAIVSTASRIKFHLAAEDRVLYPTLSGSGDAGLAALGRRYQDEMQQLSAAFAGFVAQWRVPARISADPEGFRQAANTVLKALFERMKREERDLYPLAEAL